jgi:hypothetical protein
MERIEFQPPRAVAAVASGGPLNQCVREDAVYNYGDSVDVRLINACSEPLFVFDCAQGTGKSLGRWICNDSEQRGEVLAMAGDARIGQRFGAGTGADFRSYRFTDSYSVTRAPNSRYWWVACAQRDVACRSDAQLWTRSVSAQDATVDPGARSPIAVSSSD